MPELKYCVQCAFHERIADPDPDDWFNSDDESSLMYSSRVSDR